ncbi:MAG TPA: STAS domain-containing protein [Blastocatellia bacterium]|nr:STAS domain-containing protein [Blastocatellia bacterium]
MSAAEIKTRLTEGAAVIYPGAYLNQLRGERIESVCQEFLDRGIRRIVVNFQETELINSIGISILLGVIESVNNARGALVLSNLNDSNRELFEMLGLGSHVEMAATEELALLSLSEETVGSAT